VTQVLTTHYMDEAEQLCDRLVVMDEGVIVDEGGPADLIARHVTKEVVELRFADDDDRACAVGPLDRCGFRVEPLADRVLVYADDGDALVAQLHELLPVHAESVLVRRSSLEDVFLKLTGRTLVD
jgi:lipooligosaccharide transport system ATP-binding protein